MPLSVAIDVYLKEVIRRTNSAVITSFIDTTLTYIVKTIENVGIIRQPQRYILYCHVLFSK
ncbi:hypothetical protein NQ317_016652 [Molorchus minor]|uniref:Uncharacterized protein n=1 Tax=Molorchus minor TaxID=1323400 RepID=A0ABQ9JQZ7_9CUCU|nr:hypothetical protein NQ317_016652 [Molorchus minor]